MDKRERQILILTCIAHCLTHFFEMSDDVFVSILDMHPREVSDRVRELSFHIHGTDDGFNVRSPEDAEIIFAKSWCLMNDASTTVS